MNVVPFAYETHVELIRQRAISHGSRPLFYLAVDGDKPLWTTVTYQKFDEHVERVAHMWLSRLSAAGMRNGDWIGFWSDGYKYIDVVHIMALERAGFVPQLMTAQVTKPASVYDMVVRAGSRALVHDSAYTPAVQASAAACPVPMWATLETDLDTPLPNNVPELPHVGGGERVAFVLHSSGSTSGKQKLVPYTHNWLHSVNRTFDALLQTDPMSDAPDVVSWLCTFCHSATLALFFALMTRGGCIVQSGIQRAISSEEVIHMVEQCGLNRLYQWSPHIRFHLKNAREDAKLLSALQNMRSILYSGMALNEEDDTWGRERGIKLTSIFGSTECSNLLYSGTGRAGVARFYVPMPTLSVAFVPLGGDAHGDLHELVLRADSPNLPIRALRRADGTFGTGDLFVQAAPGRWAFRGRGDDWIKMDEADPCDTKSIEDNVMRTCADLVRACVVVGSGRPSPALFVEPLGKAADADALKAEIIRRTAAFNTHLFPHERIVSVALVFVVPPHTALPRTDTKGNIRRKMVEEMFEQDIEDMYRKERELATGLSGRDGQFVRIDPLFGAEQPSAIEVKA